MTVEQAIRNALESLGVEDAQSLSSGDILEPSQALARFIRELKNDTIPIIHGGSIKIVSTRALDNK